MDQQETVFLALPSYGGQIHCTAALSLLRATRRPVQIMNNDSSALAHGFNILWASAAISDKTYWAMLHSDIGPPPFWVDTLINVMQETGADVVSALSPIKSNERAYSTALIPRRGDDFDAVRIHDVHLHQLPETFFTSDLIRLFDHDGIMGVNTGCWVCRIGPWMRDLCFEVETWIDWKQSPPLCRFLSEDWEFSRKCHNLGLQVACTRRLDLSHAGMGFWFAKSYEKCQDVPSETKAG